MTVSIEELEQLSHKIIAPNAGRVDRDALFPYRTLDLFKEKGLLGAPFDRREGGAGWGLSEMVSACYVVSSSCGTSGMVLAMHFSQAITLYRHAYPAKMNGISRFATEQRLVGSSTSEIGKSFTEGTGAALERDCGFFSLKKLCPAVSYIENADDLLVVARRSPGADVHDLVLVLISKSDFEFVPNGMWKSMGMRGTRSVGGWLYARVSESKVFEEGFRTIAERTMVPCAHALWCACWAGICLAAVLRGHEIRRKRSSRKLSSADRRHLANAVRRLNILRREIATFASEFDRTSTDMAYWGSQKMKIRANELKVTGALLSKGIVEETLAMSGLEGYNDEIIGRCARDIASAPIMLKDDMILEVNGLMLQRSCYLGSGLVD